MAVLEIVGRGEELAAIQRLFETRSGGPAALVIEGGAGIGKTTLWRQAIVAARERAYRVLACSPSESETQLALTGVRDLLDAVFDEVEPELPPPQRRALAVALLHEEAPGAPDGPGVVAGAFLTVLRLLSRTGPLLIAIDDVQWLDSSSAPVLEFALRRLEEAPVAILLALRGESIRGRARETLGRALASFEELGAAVWAEKARAELGRIRGRTSTRGELTPTEQRVAALAAEGRSNREIAATLYVTLKTVESHLPHVYSKLGVRSRTHLARRIAARPEAAKD